MVLMARCFKRRRRRMTGLERGHLRHLAGRTRADEQEIDNTLTYPENKKHLQSFALRTVEELAEEGCVEIFDPRVEEAEQRLVEDCRTIIRVERRSRKWAKYQIGERILQDEKYLNIKYGDSYFRKLAEQIDEEGYGEDQLRKCVCFRKHPDAQMWLDDDAVSWEKIRTQLLPGKEKRMQIQLGPIGFLLNSCPLFGFEILNLFRAVLNGALAKCKVQHKLPCKDCYVMRFSEEIERLARGRKDTRTKGE